ncbi:MAG: glycosyltransferase family 2 protein [Pyrinomonadaceae bacterium]
MSSIQFSIVIPTYDRAAFIEKTVASVLAQTVENFEIIIVDDGSTDNTGEIVAAIKDKRVSYYKKANEERAAARNYGTDRAHGRYVTCLDSDDIFYPDHLAVAVEMIEKNSEPEIFHLGYEVTGGDKGSYKMDHLPPIGNEELIYGNQFACRGIFLRADIAREHKFNPDRDLSATEDYELWLRLASRYPIRCDNRITSAIIQHDERSVISTTPEKLIKRIELAEKYLKADDAFMKRFGDKLGTIKSNLHLYVALHLALMKGHRGEVLRHLGIAVRLSPAALRRTTFYGTLKHIV